MERICLDTEFISEYLHRNKDARKKLEELRLGGTRLATVSISAFEIYYVPFRFGGKQSLERTNRFLDAIQVIPVTLESAKMAARIQAELLRRGTPIGIRDTLIAGVALTEEIPVLTRNLKHFRRLKEIPVNGMKKDLLVETW